MDSEHTPGAQVRISRNGPYLVAGQLPLRKQTIGTNSEGESVEWVAGAAYPDQAQYALCRCGHSRHKPFCDGTHVQVGFDGTETASRRPYLEQARRIPGPAMSLTDVETLCASARFCDPHGKVWQQVRESQAPAARAHFVRQCGDCPSGGSWPGTTRPASRWSRSTRRLRSC
ncbi:CDGSH iron-sulfur domain-containing protein [Acidovorax carolinensis]|uniref:CDGSH iron-sulfur domain-containing protein n=1 Tax=Acidovorax carolinensis TaxID=553814 RepID=UPI0019516E07|nr:CDGSH iron-sulfur domain-containing protein [Acidovorax carolinensis]